MLSMRSAIPICAFALVLAASPLAARAELVELRITSSEPFDGGARFGAAGPYERLVGVARGELDPADPHNAGIALLERAPRNAQGRVEYEIDVFILRPIDGSDTLLYDVTNRGSKVAPGFFGDLPLRAGANDPSTPEQMGDGFLLRRGYTIVWSGWDPTVPAAGDLMSARFPKAVGLRGPVRDEFVFGLSTPEVPATARLSYPALEREGARLTLRRRERDAPRELDPKAWRWVDEREIALTAGSFEPAVLYDLHYVAQDPPVLGIGFAAVRDLVAFLRREQRDRSGGANPVTRKGGGHGIEATLAVGVSQSGRFLRHFLELGMNRDEHERRVFDGVLPYIGGSGKVFANHAFGQPTRTAGQHMARLFPESWFPFAYTPLTDPLTGHSGSLLRGDASDPKIIEANSSTEYWQKGASLLHTDPLGQRDLALPPNVRLFLISGTEHAGGAFPRAHACVHPTNSHRPGAALRALLVALEAWVREGTPPPDSRIPRIADGTLVPFESLGFPRLPAGGAPPAPNRIRTPGDWVDPAPEEGPTYGVRVPAVDVDGNELAGLRLPPIAAPLATYTGWNAFREPYPVGDLCGRSGSEVRFALDAQTRLQARDPRPATRERYSSHAAYLARVSEAVDALVQARLLLPADGDAYLRQAQAARALWE
jgi:hypothetical protein